MTADQCRYWKGEGCTMEIELGIKCDFQRKTSFRASYFKTWKDNLVCIFQKQESTRKGNGGINMWRDTYDKVNLTNDGITVIFDGHYSLGHSRKILINEEEASEEEIKEFNKVEHVWVHFGLINLEGEVLSGWSILGESPKCHCPPEGEMFTTIANTPEWLRRAFGKDKKQGIDDIQ